MRCKGLLLIGLFVLLSVSCVAQGYGKVCDITGTWLGGGDPASPSYQFTITPVAAGRYSTFAQSVIDPGVRATDYTGELRKTGATTYMQSALSLWEITPEAAEFYYDTFGIVVDDLSKPEVDAVYGTLEMIDCDTIQNTITWFGIYVPMEEGKSAFVTEPDFDIITLIGEPIVETYHRAGPDCPVCETEQKTTGKHMDKKKLPARLRKR